MKILFDARVFSKGEVSGIPEYARLLLEHLLKIDTLNEYSLFLNSFLGVPSPVDRKKYKNLSVFNMHIPNRVLDFLFKYINQPKIDIIMGADVIFSPHFNILSHKKNTPRVVTFHDLSFERFPQFYSPRGKLWHWRQNPKKQAEDAQEIIAVSNSTKVDLVEYYKISPEKISVVYSGVNPFFSLPVLPSHLYEFQKEHNLPKRFILTLGTIEPRKNIQGLVRAFNIIKQKEDMRDVKLVIAGKDGWLCDDIYKEINVSPWRGDIIMWGQASLEEARNLYKLASVFATPSFLEGFGFPALEAQTCGVPVVASNRGSLPEILERSALLCDPKNDEELALHIFTLFSDQELREDMISRGYENVRRFDWEKTAQKTLEIFKKYKTSLSENIESVEI